MGTINRFEEIEAWRVARQLCRLVYPLIKEGECDHDLYHRDQIPRAAVSILSNIAGGLESRTQLLFVEFLGRAKGSASEVRSQAYIGTDAEYITQPQILELVTFAE